MSDLSIQKEDRGRRKKKELFIVGAALLVIFAIVLSISARNAPPLPGDLGITLFLQKIRIWGLKPFMKGLSLSGEDWMIPVTVVLVSLGLWLWNKRIDAVFILLTSVPNVLNLGLKSLINRPRPSEDLVQVWETTSRASFPSGHALYATVFLGGTIFLVHRYIDKRRLRLSLEILLSLLILLIGISRIYLGTHWTTDVVGGYIIGAIFLLILIKSYPLLKSRKG